MSCPQCGFANPAGFKFCGQCGAPVTEEPPAAALAAERRQITVMFCDLVGSTELSEKLDPEELRELVQRYQVVCAGEIEGHGGHIAQYLGDGVLAYFGFPQAHPDDALRAIRAALGIVGKLERPVRVGLHTGMVVVGQMGAGEHRENLAMGETPNVAARVQSAAAPGQVLISRSTYTLAEDRVDCQDLGVLALKGLSRPFRLYRVERERELGEWRSAMRRRRSRLPLVGREAEQDRLLALWEEGGHSVAVTGGMGTGKTRLLQWLKDRLVGHQNYVFSLYCAPELATSSFAPVLDLLEREFRLSRVPGPERFGQLRDGLRLKAPSLGERGALLLGRLLELELPAGSLPNLQPQALRLMTMQVLTDLLREFGTRRATLLAVEDIAQADPSTREWLASLASRLGGTRLLLVAAGPAEWAQEVLELKRLTRADAESLILALAGKPLPAELVDHLVQRGEGIPLFLQECTNLALESAALEEQEESFVLNSSLEGLGIPATLQDFLTSHLDRAGPSKNLAQRASVVGPYFAAEFLERYTQLSRSALEAHLERLVQEQVLQQLETSFAFSHGMLQQAAYSSLLKSVRQDCHLEVATTLEKHFPALVEGQPEVLAYHYTRAGQPERALEYWGIAGQKALRASANQEAATHFSQGLELLAGLPDSPQKARAELQMILGLASAHIPLHGYAAKEVAGNYSRARELCRLMGDGLGLFPVLGGLWVYYLVRGDLEEAGDLASQLLRLADQDALRLVAHAAAGQTAFYRGEMLGARQHLEQAVRLYDPEKHRGLAYEYFQSDPAVCSLSYLSWALWLQGEAELAVWRGEEALVLARQLDHSHTLAHVLFFDVWLHLHRGNLELALARNAELAALAAEEAFPLWGALAVFMDGCCGLEGPDPAGAAQRVARGLEGLQATGARLGSTWNLGLLAQLQAFGGNPAGGLEVLAQGLGLCQETGERWWEPELYRLQGDLLSQTPAGQSRVEAAYDRALKRARELGLRSLELRAACSLAGLWRKAGGVDVARDLVREVLEGLPEEPTRDQQRARELLAP